MQNEICEHCEEYIDIKIYTDSQRFCSDQCRIDYHNTKRKIDRKLDTIRRNLKDLMDILEDDKVCGHHVKLARDLIWLKDSVLVNSGRTLWVKCGDCRIDYYPNATNICPHCQSNKIFSTRITRY